MKLKQLVILSAVAFSLAANQIEERSLAIYNEMADDIESYMSDNEMADNGMNGEDVGVEFGEIDPNEKIDLERLAPPAWVVYLNKVATPFFVLYNKMHKWFRVHPSVRTRKN